MTNDAQSKLHAAETLLASESTVFEHPEENRLDVYFPQHELIKLIQLLRDTEWGYLASITGVDPGAETNEIEVIYHFCWGAAVLGLRTRVARDQGKIPSICSIIPSASFFERELSEMFGIDVEGTPVPERLFLPDNWPDGVYPLRKDYTPEGVSRPGEG
ncbi:MAG: NADH-quinone oxidoreductase subunit C [Anaerolineales bacterium]